MGRGEETPYVLVEGAGRNQFVVLKKYFVGNWDALKSGDDVELVVTREPAVRVLSAKLADV
jgi:hypothetical protein